MVAVVEKVNRTLQGLDERCLAVTASAAQQNPELWSGVCKVCGEADEVTVSVLVKHKVAVAILNGDLVVRRQQVESVLLRHVESKTRCGNQILSYRRHQFPDALRIYPRRFLGHHFGFACFFAHRFFCF